ncbi:tRNA pseudouridine(38-40) synthase TruA [candidate division KSB1 bacterium]|nr:tRNA pseudouridine(38-40) synthase TruA [candidate division KSB1 bacterium]
MTNYKIEINYDGTNFCGWQIQSHERTVQGEVQNSVFRIFHQQINLIGSGRTDAGVHAEAQVANFKLSGEVPTSKLKAAMNGTLPPDIRVLSVEMVPDSFHARFDAVKRLYHYTISRHQYAIGRRYMYFYPYPLTTDYMREAATYLIGQHDFKSFCQTKSEVNNHICTIEELNIVESNHIVRIEILANRFLHNMVRIIGGTLLDIGSQHDAPETMRDILQAKDRRAAGKTIPPHGLCLKKIYYEDK